MRTIPFRRSRVLAAAIIASSMLAVSSPALAQADSSKSGTQSIGRKAAVPSTTSTPTTSASTPTMPVAPVAKSADLLALEQMLPGGVQMSLPTAAQMQNMSLQYQGATTALAQFYAAQSSQPLGSWFQANSASLASALGAPQMASLGRVSDPLSLQQALMERGLGADPTSGWSSYSRDVANDQVSSGIVAQGMGFANKLGSLRAPDMPNLGQSASTVGLFADRAMTAFMTDFPGLFQQLSTTGGLSTSGIAAWQQSMLNATAASMPSATDGLLDPCQASLLWAMGSGSAASARQLGGGCGSCIAQGLYLHGQFSTIGQGDSAGMVPPADFNQLPSWRRSAIVGSNPEITTPSFSVASGGCGSGGSDAAGSMLTGVFAELGR